MIKTCVCEECRSASDQERCPYVEGRVSAFEELEYDSSVKLSKIKMRGLARRTQP